jgi:hypothetical protein
VAINPTANLATPILTYASPAQKKAVSNENEEEKARPLPPVEQSTKGAESGNRRKNPNQVSDNLLDDEQIVKRREESNENTSEDSQDESRELVDDMLYFASKGLSNKESDGVK